MSDILLRGLSAEEAQALERRARGAGKSREKWLIEQLKQMAVLPESYAFRIYGQAGKGAIRRYSGHPNGTSPTFTNFSQEEADAVERAANFIRRNAPGDKEQAFQLLVEQFGTDNVFEVPV